MQLSINKKYLPALSRLFSSGVIDNIIANGRSAYMAEVCSNSGFLNQISPSESLSEFFNIIYTFLFEKYRNEYFYKNTIANKVLLGKHSLNTAQMLTEFRVGRCKADVVVLNGTITVYEIKSAFDSFRRLERQVTEYRKVFDYINVITSAYQVKKLQSVLGDQIGILVLTNRSTISVVRKAESNLASIDLQLLFDSLKKDEYVSIITKYYGHLPDIPNTRLFKECKRLYCRMPVKTAYHLTINVLRKRTNNLQLKEYLQKIPTSLTAYALRCGINNRRIENLTLCLEKPFVSFLT